MPLTDRVRKLIDTSAFRRLANVSQLGLVSLVYPAAIHTRFEHSLGVYRLALLYLKRLSFDDRCAATIGREGAELLIVSALLHDLGHWPFCHPIEDMQLDEIPSHESLAANYLDHDELAEHLRDDWGIDPNEVASLLDDRPANPRSRVLSSLLSGPIDIDKIDYLARDSLHAGIPYGRQFDSNRLIASLCLNENGDGLAITDKGKTAAELVVFARYVMFSEVYWHHTVRAATAMLQRAFYMTYRQIDLDSLFRSTDTIAVDIFRQASRDTAASELVEGLFGAQRRLYKRVRQYSYFEERSIYNQLARRPYSWLADCAEAFAAEVRDALGQEVKPHEVLFDAPPPQREVEFRVDVFFPKEDTYRQLSAVSPVVKTLAQQQFDDYVKRVRIFAHQRVADAIRSIGDLPLLLQRAIDATERGGRA